MHKTGPTVLVAITLMLVPAVSSAYELKRTAFSNGAVQTAGGSYTLHATAAEAGVVGQIAGGSYSLGEGFWAGIFRALATDAPQIPVDSPIQYVNRLSQSFPNPFRRDAQIAFSIARDSRVRLSVFDVTGRRVATVLNEQLAPGRYTSTWDGRDLSGRTVASGVYFYRLDAGDFSKTKKMVKLQ